MLSSLKMAKWIMTDEEICGYLCEKNWDFLSDTKEEFTNEVTADELFDNEQTNTSNTSSVVLR